MMEIPNDCKSNAVAVQVKPLSSQRPRYIITGSAAHSRIAPLLPDHWIDCTHSHRGEERSEAVDFLFENCPRFQTRSIRDFVKCYSHLPNGSILDDKWALSRITRKLPLHLESHCFRGITGFHQFVRRTNLISSPDGADSIPSSEAAKDFEKHHLTETFSYPKPNQSDDLRETWVVKDANSNGVGGIWIVSKHNITEFSNSLNSGKHLIEGHRYVAQKYAFPPLLWHGRKFHVRCYATITSDGKAFVHHRAFLHVANDLFDDLSGSNVNNQCVHITNCCANSSNAEKFAGEICIDFEDMTSSSDAALLASFFPSIKESFASVVKGYYPFIRGGNSNGGFEYLGLDFILSSTKNPAFASTKCLKDNPIAYLLEINAPPSQDTATGLPHAEELHSAVLSDLIKMWVEPLLSEETSQVGGWRKVLSINDSLTTKSKVVPSRREILNKFQWATQESKSCTVNEKDNIDAEEAKLICAFARSQFPFFRSKANSGIVFLENAGGTQGKWISKIMPLKFRLEYFLNLWVHGLLYGYLLSSVSCHQCNEIIIRVPR